MIRKWNVSAKVQLTSCLFFHHYEGLQSHQIDKQTWKCLK